jgi:hypothetical protein
MWVSPPEAVLPHSESGHYGPVLKLLSTLVTSMQASIAGHRLLTCEDIHSCGCHFPNPKLGITGSSVGSRCPGAGFSEPTPGSFSPSHPKTPQQGASIPLWAYTVGLGATWRLLKPARTPAPSGDTEAVVGTGGPSIFAERGI